MIPGYGMGNSIELNMQDKTGGDKTIFYNSVLQFLGALNQRPEIAMAYSSYAMNFPQISVDVDAAKCKRAGISPASVLMFSVAIAVVPIFPTITNSVKCIA